MIRSRLFLAAALFLPGISGAYNFTLQYSIGGSPTMDGGTGFFVVDTGGDGLGLESLGNFDASTGLYSITENDWNAFLSTPITDTPLDGTVGVGDDYVFAALDAPVDFGSGNYGFNGTINLDTDTSTPDAFPNALASGFGPADTLYLFWQDNAGAIHAYTNSTINTGIGSDIAFSTPGNGNSNILIDLTAAMGGTSTFTNPIAAFAICDPNEPDQTVAKTLGAGIEFWSEGRWIPSESGPSTLGKWTNDNVNIPGVDSEGNLASFSQAGSLDVYVDENAIVTGITVAGGDVSIQDGPGLLLLNAAPTGSGEGSATTVQMEVGNAASTLTIGSKLTGATGLDKSGPGTLVLQNRNSYTGDTSIEAGELQIRSHGSVAGNLTAAGGSVLSGAGVIGGDLTVNNGAQLRPGDGAAGAGLGNLTVAGNVAIADNADVYFTLQAPSATKAGAGASGDHISASGGVVWDGNLHLSADPEFGTGFYELASSGGGPADLSGWENAASDFVDLPNSLLGYRLEEGSVDLVVAAAAAVDSSEAVIDFGEIEEGGSAGSIAYSIQNLLGAEFVRFAASNITHNGGVGDISIFDDGFSAIASLLVGDASQVFNASLLDTSTAGSYSATYTFAWDDILAGDNLTGLFASNGGDYTSLAGDAFYLPGNLTSGTFDLTLQATVIPVAPGAFGAFGAFSLMNVGVVPEPSRALLLALGMATLVLRRRRG